MGVITGKSINKKHLDGLVGLYFGEFRSIFERELNTQNPYRILRNIENQFKMRIKIFPEGQLAYVCDNKIVGGMSSLIIPNSIDEIPEKYEDATGGGYISNHDYNGKILLSFATFINSESLRDPKTRKVMKHMTHHFTRLASERGLLACSYTRPAGFIEDNFIFGRKPGTKEEYLSTLERYLGTRCWSKNGKNNYSLDPVLRLHEEAGAKIIKIFYNSRPKDEAAMSFCIVVQYPTGKVAPLKITV